MTHQTTATHEHLTRHIHPHIHPLWRLAIGHSSTISSLNFWWIEFNLRISDSPQKNRHLKDIHRRWCDQVETKLCGSADGRQQFERKLRNLSAPICSFFLVNFLVRFYFVNSERKERIKLVTMIGVMRQQCWSRLLNQLKAIESIAWISEVWNQKFWTRSSDSENSVRVYSLVFLPSSICNNSIVKKE